MSDTSDDTTTSTKSTKTAPAAAPAPEQQAKPEPEEQPELAAVSATVTTAWQPEGSTDENYALRAGQVMYLPKNVTDEMIAAGVAQEYAGEPVPTPVEG